MGRRRPPCSKLDTFIRANKLTYSAVSRESGVSRQHLYRIRTGMMDPTLMTAMRIRDACGRLIIGPVRIEDVFDV